MEVTATHLATFQTRNEYRYGTTLSPDGNLIITADRVLKIFTIEGYLISRVLVPTNGQSFPHFEVIFSNNIIVLYQAYAQFIIFDDFNTKHMNCFEFRQNVTFDRNGNIYSVEDIGMIAVYSSEMVFIREIEFETPKPIVFIKSIHCNDTIVLFTQKVGSGMDYITEISWYSALTWKLIDTLEFDDANVDATHNYCFDNVRNVVFRINTEAFIIPYKDRKIRSLVNQIGDLDSIHLTEDYQLIQTCYDGRVRIFQLANN